MFHWLCQLTLPWWALTSWPCTPIVGRQCPGSGAMGTMLPTPRDPEGVDVLPCSFAAATRGDRWPISAPPAGMAARMAAFMASGSTGPPGWPGFTACVLASRLPLAAESGASAAEGSTAVAAAGSPPMLAPGRGAACSGLPGPMGGYSRLTAADSVVCEGEQAGGLAQLPPRGPRGRSRPRWPERGLSRSWPETCVEKSVLSYSSYPFFRPVPRFRGK